MFGKIGLLAAVAGCGILLGAESSSPLPELSAEKRQSHLQELFRNLDSARLGAEYTTALWNNDEQALPVAFAHFRHSREFTDENLCLMLASGKKSLGDGAISAWQCQ